MLVPFFIVIFISLVASVLARRRGKEYFLAGRSIRWPMLFGTLLGTQLGGGFMIGNSDSVWRVGVSGGLYGLGLAIGMIILGCGFGQRLRKTEVSTLSELLEKQYGSSRLQVMSAVLSVLSLGGILMCQAIGLKRFLLSMGYTSDWIYLLAWSAVILYTAYGGLLAVVWTDLIQSIVMIAILVITFGTVFWPRWSEITTRAYELGFSVDGSIVASLLIPLAFIFVEQDMAQRCFAARGARDIKKGFLLTSFSMIILSVVPIACGLLGKDLAIENGSIFMQVLQTYAHPAIGIAAATAVLVAIISTASSVLLAASSNVAKDLMRSGGQYVTLSIGAVALLGPYLSDDVISSMVASYEICVGALFVPTIMAVYSKTKLPQAAAWWAAFLGIVGVILSKQIDQAWRVAIPFVTSFVGFCIGWKRAHFLTVAREGN